MHTQKSHSVIQARKHSCLLIHECDFVLLFVVQIYQKPLLLLLLGGCLWHSTCRIMANCLKSCFFFFFKLLGSKSRLTCISFFGNNDAPKVQRSSANHDSLESTTFQLSWGAFTSLLGQFQRNLGVSIRKFQHCPELAAIKLRRREPSRA